MIFILLFIIYYLLFIINYYFGVTLPSFPSVILVFLQTYVYGTPERKSTRKLKMGKTGPLKLSFKNKHARRFVQYKNQYLELVTGPRKLLLIRFFESFEEMFRILNKGLGQFKKREEKEKMERKEKNSSRGNLQAGT